MSRNFKNTLKLRDKSFGNERRANMMKEILADSTPMPLPLEYEDIDNEFRRWVSEDLDVSFDGEKVPTISLFSNQRFSEYMQSWNTVDEKGNLLVNFKSITRENNPKGGTINGQTKNIPGERTYLMKRVEAHDKNNRTYYIEYRVKQPYSVDIVYTVSLVTSKYELINKFNQMINDKFKAINCYIRPNGHFIPMKLNDISDESEYSIDNRQFYSQSYTITVMAYIMPEDSFIVEEKPSLKFMGFESDKKSTYADIEEMPCGYFEEIPYEYQPIELTVHFDVCVKMYKFHIDTDFVIKRNELDNVRSFRIYINDTEKNPEEEINIKNGDEVKITLGSRYKMGEESEIKFIGYNPKTSIERN